MARYPGAVWRPIPEAQSEPRIRPTQLIFHTAVSTAESLYAYWSRSDVGLESHFYVGQRTVEQYQDTERQADANHTANVRAISVETWDNLKPETTPWTPWQMDELVAMAVWVCRTHLIPARFCPDHDSPGIGWHSMWGAPSPWTPVRGKTCPGRARIDQMPTLLRRVQEALVGKPPIEEDPDMAFTDTQAQQLAELHKALTTGRIATQVWTHEVGKLPTNSGAAADYLRKIRLAAEGDDVDEAEVARLVLLGLPAPVIAEVIPEELVQAVAEGLAARLAD